MRLALAVVLTLVCAGSVEAQPNCRKGKPCGNTCIAQNRTCRIAPAGESAPRRPAQGSSQALVAMPAAGAPGDSLLPWVAAEDRRLYFASSCAGAASIPATQRRYFRAEDNLQRIGYRRADAAVEACTLDQLQVHERRLAAVQP